MHTPSWEKLLDGSFDSKHPRRTLWRLFADQRGRVIGAVTLYIIKQTPASLMPLAVGMIVDVLTHGGDGAFRKILWIAGGYFLLLLQKSAGAHQFCTVDEHGAAAHAI